MYGLKTTVCDRIDFAGLGFYAKAFHGFDANDLAQFLGVERWEIDPSEIRNAQDRTCSLQEGQFLRIELSGHLY